MTLAEQVRDALHAGERAATKAGSSMGLNCAHEGVRSYPGCCMNCEAMVAEVVKLIETVRADERVRIAQALEAGHWFGAGRFVRSISPTAAAALPERSMADRPLRKYEVELHELGGKIVNALDECDPGEDRAGVVSSYIWNALFGYNATIPVDARIKALEAENLALHTFVRNLADEWADEWAEEGRRGDNPGVAQAAYKLLGELPSRG